MEMIHNVLCTIILSSAASAFFSFNKAVFYDISFFFVLSTSILLVRFSVFDYIYLEIWCIQVDNAIRVYGAVVAALAVCFVEFRM